MPPLPPVRDLRRTGCQRAVYLDRDIRQFPLCDKAADVADQFLRAFNGEGADQQCAVRVHCRTHLVAQQDAATRGAGIDVVELPWWIRSSGSRAGRPFRVVVHQLLIWSDVGREPIPSVRLSRPAPVRSRPRPIPEGALPSRTARAGRASRQTTRSDHADGTAPGTHRRRRRRRSAPPCHGCEKQRSDSLLDLRFLDRALSDIITPARSIVAGVA
jgi:hypothetical protein